MKSKTINKTKVVFYINPEDKNLMKDQCDLLQIKPSFFIRNAVLEKLNKPTFTKSATNLDTRKYLSELNKIGNNLNQIAYKLNSNLELDLIDQRELTGKIEHIITHITEINSKL